MPTPGSLQRRTLILYTLIPKTMQQMCHFYKKTVKSVKVFLPQLDMCWIFCHYTQFIVSFLSLADHSISLFTGQDGVCSTC